MHLRPNTVHVLYVLCFTHHVWIIHDVQLAHLPKVFVQHLHKAVYQFQHRKLILQQAVAHSYMTIHTPSSGALPLLLLRHLAS